MLKSSLEAVLVGEEVVVDSLLDTAETGDKVGSRLLILSRWLLEIPKRAVEL